MKNDTSLLIQGPFHINSVLALDYYCEIFDEIIYSTYQLTEEQNKICRHINPKVQFIFNNPLSQDSHILNQANIANQTLTILNGLNNSHKEYIIKIRSDEYFMNLENIFLLQNNKKAIFSNIYFRSPSYYMYHVSDHIIYTSKHILFDTFHNILHFLSAKSDTRIPFIHMSSRHFNLHRAIKKLVPEQIIAIFMLHAINPKIVLNLKDPNQNINLFQEFFDIIDIDQLKPYITSLSYNNKRYFYDNIQFSHSFNKFDCNNINQYNLINRKFNVINFT